MNRFTRHLRLSVLLAICAFLASSCGPLPLMKQAPNTSLLRSPIPDSWVCKGCNILFISLTNVRHDHVGFNGYHRATSPNLDRLAQRSIVFDNAFTVASWTLPVANSLYTSQYPFSHRIMGRYGGEDDTVPKFLDPRVPTLMDVLRAQGYTTVSINGAQDYRPVHGLTNRFDQNLSLTFSDQDYWGVYGSMFDVAPAAIKWLKANKTTKFFLHLQAYDAHCPYAHPRPNPMFDPDYRGDIDFNLCYWTFTPTQPIELEANGIKKTYYSLFAEPAGSEDSRRERLEARDITHMKALYDGAIHNLDAQLQRVFESLEALNLMDNTIIVVFAEHGELLGKNGRFMRGGALRGAFYDDVLHVPLVLYHPKIAPKRVRSMVSLIGLGPTVLDLVGVPSPPPFKGKSFSSVLSKEDPNRTVFAGSIYANQSAKNFYRHATIITAARNRKMKLIRERLIYYDRDEFDMLYELYNVEEDPKELRNLAEQHFPQLEALNSQINAWQSEIVDMRWLLHAVAYPEEVR